MTLISTFDHTPTARDRQEFVVLYVLEDALRSDEAIDTSAVSVRIVEALAALLTHEETSAVHDVRAQDKPRIRVAAVRG